ncbi:Hypothetical predicted protein [Octopus vulgaris]|uniref:A-kinase anchor protein 2 C-terminal domain-containing protein n=1 Tax=Octopus vulgaris TaxID=6645 RepID=A0AA36BFE6_OCTVU|nr:Hypothetical predicted protein [Octopus vulgaris]
MESSVTDRQDYSTAVGQTKNGIYKEEMTKCNDIPDGQVAVVEISGTPSQSTDQLEALASEHVAYSDDVEDISDENSLDVLDNFASDGEETEVTGSLPDILDNIIETSYLQKEDYCDSIDQDMDYSSTKHHLTSDLLTESRQDNEGVENNDAEALTRNRDPLERNDTSSVPAQRIHQEMSIEERQMLIDKMISLQRSTIQANRRHSWTGSLKIDNYDIGTNIKTRKSSIGYDLPPKVNLYSENILQEEETTDSVDRGSIADLGNIKQNWENRLVQSTKESKPLVKKSNKVVRHWSVKLNDTLGKPTASKKNIVPDSSYHDNQNMNSNVDPSDEGESAIEREIRLALEREESLKREQELRLLRLERERETSQENNYQNQRNDCLTEHFQPTYLEMTEADRAHEITKRENDLQLEPELPKTYNSFSHSAVTRNNNNSYESKMKVSGTEKNEEPRKAPVEYRETVVQTEIRLQKEKEKNFARRSSNSDDNKTDSNDNNNNNNSNNNSNNNNTDKTDSADFDCVYSSTLSSDKPVNEPPKEKLGSPLRIPPTSKIAQELQEIRQREAELKCMRQSLIEMKMADEEPTENVVNECTVEEKVTEVASVSCESDKVNGNVENSTEAAAAAATVNPFETPIEREIRLAQEREMQFRLDKGVPVEKKPSVVVSKDKKSQVSVKPKFSLKNNTDKGVTMKKIASSRLQEEIKKEVKREVSLRDSGRINTTSVDRMGEQIRYREVSPVTPKRNFTTVRKSSVASVDSVPEDTDCVDGPSTVATSVEPQKSTGPNFKIQKPKVSTTFSYREVKSNAGSLIEQELREMKEREDELKNQRKNSVPQLSTIITEHNDEEE